MCCGPLPPATSLLISISTSVPPPLNKGQVESLIYPSYSFPLQSARNYPLRIQRADLSQDIFKATFIFHHLLFSPNFNDTFQVPKLVSKFEIGTALNTTIFSSIFHQTAETILFQPFVVKPERNRSRLNPLCLQTNRIVIRSGSSKSFLAYISQLQQEI